MELFKIVLQMNLVKNKEISSFINKMTKVGNHKTCNLYKISLNVCGPCYYELNTTNKKNINLPSYW